MYGEQELKEKQEKFQKDVWFVDPEDKELRCETLADFLSEYHSDETTTPNGVAPRCHLRTVKGYRISNKRSGQDLGFWRGDSEAEALVAMLEEAGYSCFTWKDRIAFTIDADEEIAGNVDDFNFKHEAYYELWSWGVGGNTPYRMKDELLTGEEAEIALLETFHWDQSHKDDHVPHYDSKEEAVRSMIEDRIIRYLSHGSSAEGLLDGTGIDPEAVGDSLPAKRKEWESLEIDEEGATKWQMKEMDKITEEAIQLIVDQL